MYLSNNGFFFTAISYSPMVTDLSVGYLTLIGSGLIFIVGTILFIRNFIKKTGGHCLESFILCEILKYYFRIPCDFIWKFIALTDPCCILTEVQIHVNSDGTISDNRKCLECWNTFVYLFKRIVLIISTIIYYFFLVYLAVLLLIFKFFYWLYMEISNHNLERNKKSNDNNCNLGNIANSPNIENIQNIDNNEINTNQKNIGNIQNTEGNKGYAENQMNCDINDANQKFDFQKPKESKEITKGVNLTLKEKTDINDNIEIPPSNSEIIQIKIINNNMNP